jgi:hypothetical protein
MACHWDLVGVTGPWDPNTSKWARRIVKKPVIDVDDLEDTGDRSLPSLAVDIASSSFALRNVANTLVTESAAIWAMFIQFQDTLAGSLDRLTEFLVKEQAEAWEDHHVALGLLQRLVWVAEGVPLRQTETFPATVAGNAEAGPLEAAVYTETVALDEVVGLIRQAQTPLFLPSDENTEPSDELYVDEAKGSGSEEGSEDENEDVKEDEDEDVDEDVEEADEMDIDQTLRD